MAPRPAYSTPITVRSQPSQHGRRVERHLLYSALDKARPTPPHPLPCIPAGQTGGGTPDKVRTPPDKVRTAMIAPKGNT
jgi:hypothetical protein